MNKQKSTGIDYCDYTFNPISGKCLHSCPYCYMQRFWRLLKDDKPQIKEHYLKQKMPIKPSRIFVGSSTDMWGAWIPHKWINKVLEFCGLSKTHIFLFLSKNPKRYAEFTPLENCWYGTTDDGTERTKNNIRDLVVAMPEPRRFVSFEPLLRDIEPDLSGIQWVIIGADSTKGAKKPPKEWADIIIGLAREKGIPVFVKDNYNYPGRIKEMPQSFKGGN
ncbi:MAG: DUF5131 family protein [Candidatus Omnitrophica bacterium]|nr:DUF5131 family protein [Candidatus Omnitrophota bacterium]